MGLAAALTVRLWPVGALREHSGRTVLVLFLLLAVAPAVVLADVSAPTGRVRVRALFRWPCLHSAVQSAGGGGALHRAVHDGRIDVSGELLLDGDARPGLVLPAGGQRCAQRCCHRSGHLRAVPSGERSADAGRAGIHPAGDPNRCLGRARAGRPDTVGDTRPDLMGAGAPRGAGLRVPPDAHLV
jgi:hypothetical protein